MRDAKESPKNVYREGTFTRALGRPNANNPYSLRSTEHFLWEQGWRSAESARGISPRAAHRTVREPLDSYGSCHPPKTAVFRRELRAPPVSRWPADRDASDPLPSLHPHYRGFITTTEQSAPVHRIGTFSLADPPLVPFSLRISGQVLKFRAFAQMKVTPPLHRTPREQ
jgi:hypothetical protein